MEDFEQKIEQDVVIEVVNLTRATYKEANEFRQILQDDIEKKFKKLVVDISQCDFLDSTFLGTLVLAQKNMIKIGGKHYQHDALVELLKIEAERKREKKIIPGQKVGASEVPVLIRADITTQWRFVQSILWLCTLPKHNIFMTKLELAASKPEERSNK